MTQLGVQFTVNDSYLSAIRDFNEPAISRDRTRKRGVSKVESRGELYSVELRHKMLPWEKFYRESM